MHVAFSALLAEGRPFLGTFIQSAAPEFVEAAGYAGFRFLTVDLEHTYYGPEKTVEMVRAGEAADLCVLACATRITFCAIHPDVPKVPGDYGAGAGTRSHLIFKAT